MKKQNILISLLAIFALVGCTNNGNNNKPSNNNTSNGGEDQSSIPAPQPGGTPTFKIEGFKTAKFEAELFNVENWEEADDYNAPIVENSKASGGKYLAAANPEEAGAYAEFNFELTAESANVVFSAAFAQTEEHLTEVIDLSKVYEFQIESNNSLTLPSGKNTLQARASDASWELISYNQEMYYAGVYKVKVMVLEDISGSCPSIDYIQFKVTDPNPAIDPSGITENDIPDNDMRNLQQYKYVVEQDVYKYKTYATGGDFSAPRGMKLRYEELTGSGPFYFQVATTEAGLATAEVRQSSSNVLTFHNAYLDTKYYYRAANSEAGLASAAVKNITSTAQAPRVVYVPDVLNFRDIGGWSTSLVDGAKVNQGLYFRCAQLDAATGSTKSCLSSDGKGHAALKELGIKCDIDMRDSYNQPNSGRGPSKTTTDDWPITFVSAAVPSSSEPVRWEGGTYNGTNIAQQYVKIFDALANCDNEPVMLHCTYGADRTGIVTFFLEALLGMEMEDMIKDYLWTQFTQGRSVKILESEGAEFPQWVKKTQALEGATFAEKMKNHLMDFGIEEEKLEHIRELFVPGYVAQA